ncbi:MAG: hypothetical protein QOH46_1552 [Solirubrobacteraceae bacterium]|nr:hypothetical protein [Solirubrobacteraceae bacterium]
MIATRRQAGVRAALGAAAAMAGLGAAAIAVTTSSSATVWLLVAYVVATSAVAARDVVGAVRVPRVRSRSRAGLGPLIPSRRRAVAQLRRDLDRLPETQHPTGR